jgi:hypothetical protein
LKYTDLIKPAMIAPCGMNCAVCIGYLREKKPCAGCNGDNDHKPRHCSLCRIKTCDAIGASRTKFCFSCEKFPCARLKQLDKRYRTKYRMSMVENLENIRAFGIREFVRREKRRWTCRKCGGIVCVHREDCLYCGQNMAD